MYFYPLESYTSSKILVSGCNPSACILQPSSSKQWWSPKPYLSSHKNLSSFKTQTYRIHRIAPALSGLTYVLRDCPPGAAFKIANSTYFKWSYNLFSLMRNVPRPSKIHVHVCLVWFYALRKKKIIYWCYVFKNCRNSRISNTSKLYYSCNFLSYNQISYTKTFVVLLPKW